MSLHTYIFLLFNFFFNVTYQCFNYQQVNFLIQLLHTAIVRKFVNYKVDFFKCHDSQKNKDNLHISLKAIKLGTQNFSDCNCIGEGRFWKLYEGEVDDAYACTRVVVKRWDGKYRQGHIQFLKEFETLLKYKHENIIGLVGYCNEMNEKIIVYEHACNGSLNKHLDNPSLTWMKRLKICIDAATGLKFLHEGGVEQEAWMRHRDIRSGSILLDADWNAEISNLEFSTKVAERAEHLDDNAFFSLGYIDPCYETNGFLSKCSDIYSLGVILFEMLCGKLAWTEGCENHSQSLGPSAVRYYNEEGNLDKMIFEGIKEQITPQSLTTFQMIAIQCLQVDWFKRPAIDQIIIQLQKALEFQVSFHTSILVGFLLQVHL
uniref:Putative tyrosine-protein kinase, non-receptor SYK/ZAP-70 n=1 Tax=Helianthus annuus TaxID=4232 RepID=A0A251TE94_HELAN